MIFLKILTSIAIAGVGLYALTHVVALARKFQEYYVRQAERVQEKKGWASWLFVCNPEIWKTPFMWFMFRAGVIFLGVWLLLLAYPIMFGPITL